MDCGRSVPSQHLDDSLVIGSEFKLADLVRQVDLAKLLFAGADWDAEKRRHAGMILGKAGRAWIVADHGHTHGLPGVHHGTN